MLLIIGNSFIYRAATGVRIDPCAALRDITGGYVYVYGYLFFMHFWTFEGKLLGMMAEVFFGNLVHVDKRNTLIKLWLSYDL